MVELGRRILLQLETSDPVHRAVALFLRTRRKIATMGVVVVAVWVGYHVVFGANGMIVYQQKKMEYRRLEKEIDSLQKQNDGLARQVESLRTDPKAIEKEAREQLRYAKPGEVIYLLPQQTPADQPGKASAKK